MQSLIVLLLIAMFSLSLWATPGKALDCEILAQTSYGRIVRLLALGGHISAEQLESLSKEKRPTNPFKVVEKHPNNYTFRTSIDREMNTPDALGKWPETQQALIQLANQLRAQNKNVTEAQVRTKFIFSPKLYAQPTGADFHIKFNPVNNQIVAWKTQQSSRFFTFDLLTKTTRMKRLDSSPTVLVRRNGEVWTAGYTEHKQIYVRNLNSNATPIVIPVINPVKNLELFETPDGRLLLAHNGTLEGTYLYDVTTQETAKELFKEPEWRHPHPVVFHVSQKGSVFVAMASHRLTKVYTLENGLLKEVGEIPHSSATENHVSVITTDANDTLYLGETINRGADYRVVTFVNGKPNEVFSRTDVSGLGQSADFHWNAKGELILFLSRGWDGKRVYLFNVLNPEVPDITIPIDEHLEKPPSWFTLPGGRKVIALSPVQGAPLVFDPNSESVVWKAPAVGTENNSPIWMPARNGNIYLAIDTTQGWQIYDVWHGEDRP